MQQITEKCYARLGLIGNPSDGYSGKTLSVICKNFYAEVTLTPSDQLVIVPDVYQFDSVTELVSHVGDHGYYGAQRLFRATIKVFADYLSLRHSPISLSPAFNLSYQTNVPRMVGLAGSSALIVAMLKALMKFYDVAIDLQVLPSLALKVERYELKIGGGLQDRVIQFYEGLVAMDFSESVMIDGLDCGRYQPIDPMLLPPLYMAYTLSDSEPTEIFHNDLQSRYAAGEPLVVDTMSSLVSLTNQAVDALQNGDHRLFGALMDKNFDLRNAMSKLNPHHVAMIETARSCGVSAKYAGSGGAIVGVCEEESTFDELQQELGSIGCSVIRPVVN